MATFNAATPDQGATRTVETRVNAIRFGDGYEQRVGDGINNIVESWSLNFSLRSRAVINLIDNFLLAQKGVKNFNWLTPQGVTKKFVCKKWQPIYNHDGDCSLSCVFEQDFGI